MLKRIGPCRVSTGSPGQRPLILGAEAGPAVQATASTQRRVRVVRLDLHGMPEREDMVGEVESDPLEVESEPPRGRGWVDNPCVSEDERLAETCTAKPSWPRPARSEAYVSRGR
jgi:hypothetical protein